MVSIRADASELLEATAPVLDPCGNIISVSIRADASELRGATITTVALALPSFNSR